MNFSNKWDVIIDVITNGKTVNKDYQEINRYAILYQLLFKLLYIYTHTAYVYSTSKYRIS